MCVYVCVHTVLSLCDTPPFASVFDVPLIINIHPFKDKCETEIGVVYLLNWIKPCGVYTPTYMYVTMGGRKASKSKSLCFGGLWSWYGDLH